MEETKLTYEEAVARLQGLVEKVEKGEGDFAQIEADIKQAMELIKFCKSELQGYKERFSKLQEESK